MPNSINSSTKVFCVGYFNLPKVSDFGICVSPPMHMVPESSLLTHGLSYIHYFTLGYIHLPFKKSMFTQALIFALPFLKFSK